MKSEKYIKRSSVILTSVMALMALSSCEKELDFKYHDIEPLMVIEAAIDQNGSKVSLTYTTPMDEPFDNAKLTDAVVNITDVETGNSEQLSVGNDGFYRGETAGEIGHQYRITVEREGKLYQSESRMLSEVEIQDLNFCWVKMPGDDMAVLQIHFTDNPITADYYWVRVYRNGEAYLWNATSDMASVNGIVEENFTTTHRDESQEDEKSLLRDGDEVTVTVTPIDKLMFDYLTALSINSNGARLYTGDFCLGYFLASPVAKQTIVYHPDNIDYAK